MRLMFFLLGIFLQCWEKLKARFPEAGKEQASLRSYFRVLCFRAEAVSELVLYAHLMSRFSH